MRVMVKLRGLISLLINSMAMRNILPGLPRRAVLLAVASYAAVFLAVMPFFIGAFSHRLLDNVMVQGALVAQKLAIMPEDAQDWRGLDYGFFVKAVIQNGDRANPAWLAAPRTPRSGSLSAPLLDDMPLAIELGDGSWAANVGHVPALLLSDQPWVVLSHSQAPTMAGLEVVFKRQDVSDEIWSYIRFIALFHLLVLFTMVVLLHIYLQRTLRQSVDALYRRLYRGRLGIEDDAGALRLSELQDRLQENIDEQARLASLGAGVSKLAHDVRNLLASLQLIAERLMNMEPATEQKLGQRMNVAIERALVFRILYNLALNAVQAMQSQAAQRCGRHTICRPLAKRTVGLCPSGDARRCES